MPHRREFIFLTGTGRRPSVWLRIGVAIAVVAAFAILLWLGLIIALAVFLLAILAVLPIWVWRLFAARQRPEGPATIEGEYVVTTKSPDEIRDEAAGGKPTGDVERR